MLDKLLRNTGPFPLHQATLQLATSPQAPTTAVNTATIFTLEGKTTTGVAQRGLGWDLNTAFSRPRGEVFPITGSAAAGRPAQPGSFGHTGFTGTSIWIDPTSSTYVILLANAIHPRGNSPISILRDQVATAAAKALGLSTVAAPGVEAWGFKPLNIPAKSGASAPENPELVPLFPPTLSGIDVLERTDFAPLKSLARIHNGSLNLALLTNQSGIDAHGKSTIDILAHADPTLHLTKIFTPEHGLLGRQDIEHLQAETDPATKLPVVSLYGSKPVDKRPKREDLANVDAVVIDLQDVGVRFWTYEAVLGYFLEATECGGPDIFVLDRPNPVGGLAVQGNTSSPELRSYNAYMPLPGRHGLTYGELAQYFQSRMAPACDLDPRRPGEAALTVIPMQHWQRAEFFADTGLPFTPPSPNMRTLAATILYPGIGLIEQTNISVGRGTETPFENIGAPWINAAELAAYLTGRNIPGIRITPTTMSIAETPEHYPSHGQTIPGIHCTITDRAALDSPELGIEMLAALHRLYPAQFQLEKAAYLLADPQTLSALKTGADPRAIAAGWAASLAAFRKATAPYLLYH